MKAITQTSAGHNICANLAPSAGGDALAERLTSWLQRLGYFSIFAALPAVAAARPADAPAEDAKRPETRIAEPSAIFHERQRSRCAPKPDLLRPQSGYRLPHQRGRLDLINEFAGTDDCPGRVIPAATYTSAAPYVDSGSTIGANNTVNAFYCYYCDGSTPGPDHVYSF